MLTSRALTPFERNYPTFKLEALALINALTEFHEYLYGQHFIVHTDHQALVSLQKQSPKQRTLGSWLLKLWEYNFEIQHVSGKNNILPDMLSRMYDANGTWGVDFDTRLKHFSAHNDVNDNEIPVAAALAENVTVNKTVENRTELMKMLGKKIPEPAEREKIVQEAHNRGHYGFRKVLTNLFYTEQLWWPEMAKDIEKFTANCPQCQAYDVKRQGFHPMRSPEAHLPMDWWEIDIITLPTSANQFSYILVILDLFTGFCITRPMKTKDAATIAATIYPILCEFGSPKIIYSDQGTEFMNSILEQLSKLCNFELKAATPQYHRSVGAVERSIKTIKSSLLKMLQGSISAWDVVLPYCTFLFNTTVKSTTKSTPFSLMFMRSWNNPVDKDFDPRTLTFNVTKWIQSQKHILDEIFPVIKENIDQARKVQAESFAKRHKIVEPLEVGAKVMALNTNRTAKTQPAYVGPFVVKAVHPTGSYEIGTGNTAIRRARSHLKQVPDESKEIDNIINFDSIVDHRGDKNNPKTLEYRVRWRGYTAKDDTWEKESNIFDKAEILKYWGRNAPERLVKKTSPAAASSHQAENAKITKKRKRGGN